MRILGRVGEASAKRRSLRQIKPNSSRYFRHKNFAYIGGTYGILVQPVVSSSMGFVVSEKKTASFHNNLR